MDEVNMNAVEVSRAAGLSSTFVHDLMRRDRTPNIENLGKIAAVLGTTVGHIYDGDDLYFQTVPVIGAVSAGESWTPFDDPLGEVALRVAEGGAVALEITGDSMTPVYRAGDVIIGAKTHGQQMQKFIGLDCIVETDGDERYVKYLAKARAKGRFNLRSYNPAYEDKEDVALRWAAPIRWVRRGHWR